MQNPVLYSSTVLRAMAHPTRLRLLQQLVDQEACVCHLTARLHKRQAHVSQHLTALRRAGLVEMRKEGLRVYYRIADPRVQEILRAFRIGPAASRRTTVRGCHCPDCTGDDSRGPAGRARPREEKAAARR